MDVAQVTDLHRDRTERWHHEVPTVRSDGFLAIAEKNHQQNFLLWHEEDIARRDDLGPDRVQQAKRAIDQYNQQRNNLIEQMDQFLIQQLSPATTGCRFNSETPGMIIDRLSILALKYFHMNEEVQRTDASTDHVAKCRQKLSTISQQLHDLSTALTELLADVRQGTRSFRVYFQFKMYNDADLNPQLRKAA